MGQSFLSGLRIEYSQHIDIRGYADQTTMRTWSDLTAPFKKSVLMVLLEQPKT
jgi:hypothetical protein